MDHEVISMTGEFETSICPGEVSETDVEHGVKLNPAFAPTVIAPLGVLRVMPSLGLPSMTDRASSKRPIGPGQKLNQRCSTASIA